MSEEQTSIAHNAQITGCQFSQAIVAWVSRHALRHILSNLCYEWGYSSSM